MRSTTFASITLLSLLLSPLQAGKLSDISSDVRGDDNSSSNRDDDDDDRGDRRSNRNRRNFHSDSFLFRSIHHFYPTTPIYEPAPAIIDPSTPAISADAIDWHIPETSFEIGGEWGFVDDDIDRIGARASVIGNGWIIRGNWNNLREDTPTGTDEISIGELVVGHTLLSGDASMLYATLGPVRFEDDLGSESGFLFELGVVVTLAPTITLNSQAAIGSIGDADLTRFRFDLGAHFKHSRVYAGYEHLEIGSTDIGGPYIGIGLTF